VSSRWIGVDQNATGLTPQDYREESEQVARGDTHQTRRMCLQCPHCGHDAIVRTSRRLSPLLREVYYQCSNVVCGHTFKANLEIIKTLSPSSMPNPAIAAQLSPHHTQPLAPPSPVVDLALTPRKKDVPPEE